MFLFFFSFPSFVRYLEVIVEKDGIRASQIPFFHCFLSLPPPHASASLCSLRSIHYTLLLFFRSLCPCSCLTGSFYEEEKPKLLLFVSAINPPPQSKLPNDNPFFHSLLPCSLTNPLFSPLWLACFAANLYTLIDLHHSPLVLLHHHHSRTYST